MVHMFYRLSALARFFVSNLFEYLTNLLLDPHSQGPNKTKQQEQLRISKTTTKFISGVECRDMEFQSYARYARKKDHTATPTQR